MVLMLYVHPDESRHLLRPEQLVVEPAVPIELYIDAYGNRCSRINAAAGKLRLWYDNIVRNNGEPEPSIAGTHLHTVNELPAECLQFLLPSRYCEVDKLSDTAWQLFGQTPPTWERAKAIVDWSHEHVEFGYQYASPTKTAFDCWNEKRGVCRDYMHLAITMLRAMNIPARYATGYLGDIGVPAVPAPMDFSAYLEVFLSGRWWAMDARHNKQRVGRIKQAHGRDAVDVALTTSFGASKLEKFTVWTDELPETEALPTLRMTSFSDSGAMRTMR